MEPIPHFIDGEFVSGAGTEGRTVANPATQAPLGALAYATDAEVDRAVRGAERQFQAWREVPAPERARLLFEYQRVLKANQNDLAGRSRRRRARPLTTPGAKSGAASRWWSMPAAW